MTITVTLDKIREAAQRLVSLLGETKIVAFHGEMGSGKTTLIKAVCECMGCVDVVNSPTFAIINEYFTTDGATIYHFDFYRLKNVREALDLGIEEYFHSGHFCFMEWLPEQIEPLLPENHIKISIEKGASPDTRILNIDCYGNGS
ncbi:MAG: tRNA (adenosine(37)-N6)-threonylcarbamoyltransferase complex ATPase subunit type 1 TsaE [Bacteroidales bacterium]|nr:tRNA (adenosine(37)-N6)-threonylcarbamoyltransferase complex ATPase subunit type 1 TsaE [Bacteroidales bacterium]